MGTYIRLVDFNSQQAKEEAFLQAVIDSNSKFRFNNINEKNFSKIPGSPIAYWVSEKVFNAFANYPPLKSICAVKNGMSTTDNNRFVRHWYECNNCSIGRSCNNAKDALNSKKKWFPYNKGGEFRKYYGNIDLVVNWYNDGMEIKKAAEGASGGRIVSQEFYFMRSLSWSKVTAGQFVLRFFPEGFLFDVAGPSIFSDFETQKYILGFMNSKVKCKFLDELYPTINYEMGQVGATPIIISTINTSLIDELVEQNISLSKTDWDSFETSWDFTLHPLVKCKMQNAECKIEQAFRGWEKECEDRFNTLKANEEELNRIFIDIYGLEDELTPEVEDKDVTVRRADLVREIKSLISYAVGCMFGRYSPIKDGLLFAGGTWDYENIHEELFAAFGNNEFSSRNMVFNGNIIDRDNIIPITDEEYFAEDIVSKFVEFIRSVYGKETLNENLDFIANALGNKGGTSREVIKNYFLKDFYKDHVKTYQKRPIYWMFDSGKEDGFKALIYLHRYNEDTVGRIRTDYLHKGQSFLENSISHCDAIIEDGSAADKAKAVTKKEKLIKQLAETRVYDQAIAHKALERVKLDLDDGVVVNYAKFQGIEVAREGQKTIKIDLLGKI